MTRPFPLRHLGNSMHGSPRRLGLTDRKLDGFPPPGFDCGRPDQNVFLYERAWADQQGSLSTTYLFFRAGICAGYATVLMDSLPLSRSERGAIPYRNISAVKLAQLAVDQRFQGEGIGTALVSFSVELAYEVRDRVACRYVTLDAEPDLAEWYGRQGFVHNRLRQSERVAEAIRHHRRPEHVAVSMRFDLGPG